VNAPNFFLGSLIAVSCGLLFHLIRGGRLARLGLYVITAWSSFFVGHFVGVWINLNFMRLGTLHLFPALLATLVGLITANVLAGSERGGTPPQRR
jgi:hypothetical protein